MLNIRLRKSFGAFTLEVATRSEARVIGLFGPSGSGKTTLLNSIAGITAPDSGLVTVDGGALVDTAAPSGFLPIRNRGVGYVFQDGLLFPHLTVEENLRYGENAHGTGPEFRQVTSVLELEPFLQREATTLSGGEARRVALGRALLSGPRLMLLDEPLTGLDRRLAGKTLAYLHAIVKTFAIPTIYVSHTISDIMFLCDEVWVLDNGRVVDRGHPRHLLPKRCTASDAHEMVNLFEAAADASIPELTAFRVGTHRLVVGGAAPGFQEVTQRTTVLSIPANDIILARVKPDRISARNILAGHITRVVEGQGGVWAFVDVGVEWAVAITPSAVRDLGLEPGTPVFAIVKASSISILGT